MDEPSPRSRRAILDSLLEYNPFYLLSAACMLSGCLALTNSLSWTSIRPARLLLLMGTLNLYELILVGLGLYLLVGRGIKRDGLTLLCLEAFFLVDVSFLNAEIFAADFRLGLIVNLFVLAVAIFKLAVIFRMLGISPTHPALSLILAQLCVLFAFAGIFKHASSGEMNGRLPPGLLYVAWWVVGLLLPLAAALAARLGNLRCDRARVLLQLLLYLPIVSMIAHVGTSHWIYKVTFSPAHLTPLLLGLSAAAGCCDLHVRTLAVRMRTQLLLPPVAASLSIWFPHELVFGSGMLVLSPLRLAMIGVILVYLHGWWLHQHALYVIAMMLGIGGSVFMMVREAMWGNILRAIRNCLAFAERNAPRSGADWGIVAVMASFVLLGLGVLVSLRRKEDAADTAVDAE